MKPGTWAVAPSLHFVPIRFQKLEEQEDAMETHPSGSMRLTPLAKTFVAAAIVTLTVLAVNRLSPGFTGRLFPAEKRQGSLVPEASALPAVAPQGEPAQVAARPLPGKDPGCANLSEVRLELWAWNAQLGLMYATGGPRATAGSLMCERGVNLRLLRQDDPTKMREDLAALASALKSGAENPAQGTHLVAIMGDGSATFLQELNTVLLRLGPEYRAKVVASSGYSWGEDKLMGPPAWRQSPAASRGALVAGVLRDGDWNIAQKWLGENRLCNNPDEHTYDPDCLNWMATPGYIEAAQAYVAGACEERPVVRKGRRTGESRRACVDGVVTWTPGDVMIAQKRGGLVSVASTREYRGQMPQVLIGVDRWMRDHREIVEGLIAAMLEGGDQVRSSPEALRRGAEVSAQVYGEETPEYWARYFHGVVERDAQGLMVELGGSRVNNVADNLQLFGVTELAPGAANLFAATYTVFGNVVVAQYPELVPRFAPVEEVLDTSYLVNVARRSGARTAADLPSFSAAAPLREEISRGAWNISFAPGAGRFGGEAPAQLDELFRQLVIAGGTAVEIHGHTDSTGDPRANQALSEERAFAVKRWLEAKSPANFPQGRLRVFAHGQEQPVAPNATTAGRAQNRRVEIVLGMTR